MTNSEPEWLALRLLELVERRAQLCASLESALTDALTADEVNELEQVLLRTEKEQSEVEGRLLLARRSLGAGGTG